MLPRPHHRGTPTLEPSDTSSLPPSRHTPSHTRHRRTASPTASGELSGDAVRFHRYFDPAMPIISGLVAGGGPAFPLRAESTGRKARCAPQFKCSVADRLASEAVEAPSTRAPGIVSLSVTDDQVRFLPASSRFSRHRPSAFFDRVNPAFGPVFTFGPSLVRSFPLRSKNPIVHASLPDRDKAASKHRNHFRSSPLRIAESTIPEWRIPAPFAASIPSRFLE